MDPIENAVHSVVEPRRQRIVELIWAQELAAGEIARAMADISFGAVSQHLKVLREAGVVAVRKAGRKRYYTARPCALGPMAEYYEARWGVSLERLKELAEAEESDHP